jgi:DNA-binding MarR family transcriptional regulator
MPDAPIPEVGSAFLLAQLGAHATARYAERVARLGLTPAQTGLMRLVAIGPGLSQRDLAARLGVVPSKVVGLVDELESRGLLERRRSTTDRRNHALHLTDRGRETMAEVRVAAVEHDAEVTTALTDEERGVLAGLLRRVADQQGLRPGVHPGYRDPRRRT